MIMKAVAGALLALGITASHAAAGDDFYDVEPRIWKTVRINPGESPWSACRRNFADDYSDVRQISATSVSCYVPYYYMYGRDQRRQNFN